ncbi:MAG: PEP-CTERM sorting domain-containing protein [Verrucomicrobiota bacterium]
MNKIAVITLLAGIAAQASTQAATSLYSTVDDFNGPNSGGGWSGNTIAGSSAWDYDGSTINGAANSAPGGAGSIGSLAVTPTGASLGWTQLGELYVGNFDSARVALDPGYAAGFFPAATGTLTMVYTVPDNGGGGGGTYYQPMLGFNAGWGWSMNGPDSTTYLGTIGGLETYQGSWNYSIPDNSPWGVNLMIGANTDYAPVESFYFDAIQVTASVVPEPATLSLLGLGALGLVLRRKQS